MHTSSITFEACPSELWQLRPWKSLTEPAVVLACFDRATDCLIPSRTIQPAFLSYHPRLGCSKLLASSPDGQVHGTISSLNRFARSSAQKVSGNDRVFSQWKRPPISFEIPEIDPSFRVRCRRDLILVSIFDRPKIRQRHFGIHTNYSRPGFRVLQMQFNRR